jgi:hypothetical protein
VGVRRAIGVFERVVVVCLGFVQGGEGVIRVHRCSRVLWAVMLVFVRLCVFLRVLMGEGGGEGVPHSAKIVVRERGQVRLRGQNRALVVLFLGGGKAGQGKAIACLFGKAVEAAQKAGKLLCLADDGVAHLGGPPSLLCREATSDSVSVGEVHGAVHHAFAERDSVVEVVVGVVQSSADFADELVS